MISKDSKITANEIANEFDIFTTNDKIILKGNQFMEIIGEIICERCRTKECDCEKDKVNFHFFYLI